jgi:hypothetical protein
MSGYKPVNTHRPIYLAGGIVLLGCAGLVAWAVHSMYRMELAPLMACVDDSSSRSGQWVCRKAIYTLRLSSDDVKVLNRTAGASLAVRLADKKDAEQMLEYFVSRGVDINSADAANGGLTALHKAVQANQPRDVELLLAHGAMTDMLNSKNQMPLEMAKELQQLYPQQDRSQVIKLLTASGRPKYSGFVRYDK